MTTYSQHFERRTRDNGETFTTLTDDAPEWLRDAILEAHDDELPNDWRYETCESIVGALEDGAEPEEIADSLVDVYTGPLFQWLADYIGRGAYCDEALESGLAGGTSGDGLEAIVRAGQYLAIETMARGLAEAIAEHQDDDEDEEEEQ